MEQSSDQDGLSLMQRGLRNMHYPTLVPLSGTLYLYRPKQQSASDDAVRLLIASIYKLCVS